MNIIKQLTTVFIALIVGGMSLTINADIKNQENYRYKYISLMPLLSQMGLDNFPYPAAIDEQGRVYIVTYDADFNEYLVVYEDGKITELLKNGSFFPADGAISQRGTLAGIFRTTETAQAAIYEQGKIKLLPRLTGERASVALSINNAKSIFIQSSPPLPGNSTYRLYKNGQIFFSYTPSSSFDAPSCWRINNKDQISGCIAESADGPLRALRFSPPNYKPETLMPTQSEKHSLAFGINNKGNVLGMTFNDDGLNSRIGIWDTRGNFTTYFEGRQAGAHFNDNNLIVLLPATFINPDNGYFIPKPGLSVKLDELPNNKSEMLLPIVDVKDINNWGDIVGIDCGGFCAFILKRIN